MTGLASLERAGVAPRPAPVADLAAAGKVWRRGARVLEAMGLEPPAEPAAVRGLLAVALPEIPWGATAWAETDLLARAVAERDAELSGRAARALAGLGPGLTPAGDDLLAGAAAAVAVLGGATGFRGDDRASWLAALTSVHAAGRTTGLSARLLALAARGTVLRPVVALLELTPEADASLPARVAALRRVGHSTGRLYAVAVGTAACLLGRPAGRDPTWRGKT